jgi:exonuclease SbcD
LRFVHTSDWHLGRRLNEADRTDDQAYALDQIFDVCKDGKADALVVAGDIYDRAVPPVEAVDLLDGFVARCVRELKLRVVLLSGNHDSAQRLGFGAELLAAAGVTLATRFEQRLTPIVVAGVPIHVLPYLEPEVARAALLDESLRNHDAAVRAALAEVHARRAPGPAVLVGHMFAAGGRETADSERPLSVGSAGQVGGDALVEGGWSYVALGHLHAPQLVGGREHVRYSGSLLKYSFSEHDHPKGVELVEIDASSGAVRIERVVLPPRRDVLRIEGSFAELLEDPRFSHAEPAWVEATYSDTGYVLEAAQRLRQRYPNLVAARPRQLLRVAAGETLDKAYARGDRDLLAGFWRHVSAGGELEEAHLEAYERALHAARTADVEGDGGPTLELLP